jgi:hypothetical protein
MRGATLHNRKGARSILRLRSSQQFATIHLVPDTKLNALVTLVKELVRERGYAKYETIQNFLSVRYKRVPVMELCLALP